MAELDEEMDDAPDEEFERLRDLLFLRITEFVDAEEVSDELLAVLLLELAVTSRMMAYVVSVDKPSGFGLKLDLDHLRRDVDKIIRIMKKNADDYIAQAKEALAQVEAEAEPK